MAHLLDWTVREARAWADAPRLVPTGRSTFTRAVVPRGVRTPHPPLI